MIYHDGTRFVATLTDKQGHPIGGAAIEITINGRSYDKITDEKGSVRDVYKRQQERTYSQLLK